MPIQPLSITRYKNNEAQKIDDVVAMEEPLEISLAYVVNNVLHFKIIAVTMRTPGHDAELALGFLFTENIITSSTKINKIEKKGDHKICIFIDGAFELDLKSTERNFYTTSSCGVCGKASIEAIMQKQEKNALPLFPKAIKVDISILYSLKDAIQNYQSAFQETGGIHAATLFDTSGTLLSIFEDVGRHNALDKLIGHQFQAGNFALPDKILLLSGRASFELIQKASAAQIPIVCAIGAPSTLAVSLAEEMDITLVGFLKSNGANVYCGGERIEV